MFTTPSRTQGGRSSTPLSANHGARSAPRHSRAGTPLFANQNPASPPPSFLSPAATANRNNVNDVGDVSSSSFFLPGTSRPRTTRSRPRPSSMLARPGATHPDFLSPGIAAYNRDGSVISDDAEMRSVADSVHSASAYGGRRVPLPPKDARGQLDEGTILLGDQWINVSAYSKLPTEVLDELQGADFYIDAFQGQLDVQTGYAHLLTRTKCFVWNYSSRGSSLPTCFVFPVPEYASSSMSAINDLAHCSFIPRGPTREPALLLVAPDGQICLWEGISSSLTRQDRAQRLSAPLSGPNETITRLQRVDESTLILATSQSRLLRISLGSRSGSLQAEIRPFSQPRGIFGRLFGSASSAGFGSDGILSIAVGPADPTKQGREVAAIGKRMVQKWHVLEQGGERLIAEQDVQQVVASGVLQMSDERYSAAQSLAFDLWDGAIRADGKLVLLFSQSKAEKEPLQYGFALLDAVKDAGSFVVASILPIKYRSYADPRPYASPSLSMPNGGPAAFITFADAVVAKQIEDGCESFEEVIKLKNDVSNRFIGTGCDAVEIGQAGSVAALSLISASSGSLLIEINLQEIRKRCTAYTSSADRQRAETERLKGKLEQALYFSESSLNPLTFQLPDSFEGTLMTACEQLSREILNSINPIASTIPYSVDLRSSLKDRLTKLRFMIKFVADCGHLEKLPQTTKRQLRADAELAAALNELWVYQNEFFTQSNQGLVQPDKSPLAEAIEIVMTEQGHGMVEDVVRSFFRHYADLINHVLDQLLRRAQSVTAQPLRKRSSELLELNRVVLSALRAALRYRKESGPFYGILPDNPAVYEAWTGKPGSVQLLETLFSITASLIPDRTREFGSSIDAVFTEYSSAMGEESKKEQRVQIELKSQLSSLSEVALACYEERLQYLEAAASSDAGFERERAVFDSKYRSSRPMFIHPLVTIGRADRAFALAEQYQDFRTLVELSNDAHLRSEARIETYFEKYKQSFAFELYAWYIEQNKPRTLLEQKPEYNTMVEEYLTQSGNDRLGWLHDLVLQRFDRASDKLSRLALGESSLLQRKTMLSLSKLSFLSTKTVQDIQRVGTQKQIETFDDELDLIAVQNSLVMYFENAIGGGLSLLDVPSSGGGTKESNDLVDEIVSTVATRLNQYPAYRHHYRCLVEKLLFKGEYVHWEDLIDLLTLKDTPQNQLEDFGTAVKVIIRSSMTQDGDVDGDGDGGRNSSNSIPQSRVNSCLRSIWTRAVIRDDWNSLSETNNVSDQVLIQDLKATALYTLYREVLDDETNRPALLDLEELVHQISQQQQQPQQEEEQEEQDSDSRKQHQQTPDSRNQHQEVVLKARFIQTYPEQMINLLLQDQQKESATLISFWEDTDLPRLATQVAAEAAQETVLDEEEDVNINMD